MNATSRFKLNSMAATFIALSATSIQLEADDDWEIDATSIGLHEELVVLGTRSTIQNSIGLKRESISIVDGLSSDEIGAIPALSIGEALETITGAAGHRDNGGATEISVRGLGPFLGTTLVNGREATNGGGNRAVNFSIFPAEMFNEIAIHKTQSAEYIEGAVGGQIHLNTKKPLEYGRRNVQVTTKGAFSPDEAASENGQVLGARITGSYIDQFYLGKGGSLGVSIGAQLRNEANPEQEYTTSSSNGRLEACQLTSFSPFALPIDPVAGQRCDDENSGVSNTEIQAIIDEDPNDDINSVDDIPFAYIARDHRYRANETGDERQAFFGVLQWQPNDRFDIAIDYQFSERDQTESRHDLQFASTQEDISSLVSNPTTGIVFQSTSETPIYTFTTDFQRIEEYQGMGVNVDLDITSDLKFSFDVSHSETLRTETDIEIRLGATDDNQVSGESTDFTTTLDFNSGEGIGLASIVTDSAFTPSDASFFNATNRARIRARQVIRENTINAIRGDFEWSPNGLLGMISTVKGGARHSTLDYLSRGGNRDTTGQNLFEFDDFATTTEGSNLALSTALNCARSRFPEADFLDGERDGELINVTNENGSSASSEFATFDFNCLGNELLANVGGLSAIQLDSSITSSTDDVSESTWAFYAQANFEGLLGEYEIRGNFGIRSVSTEITSIGYLAPVTVEDTGAGLVVSTVADGLVPRTTVASYFEVLPSASLIVDLRDDLSLRTGLFKGLSRPDPSAYGSGRIFTDSGSDNQTFSDLAAVFNGVTATGNPNLTPLTSINFDIGLEWYANDDTLIAGGFYYKNFLGGFENVLQSEAFIVNGEEVQGIVSSVQTSEESSNIFGFEFTATHAFDYLPGILSGFGAKLSYNYADSDFEFEDGAGGDGIALSLDENGNVVETELIGIIPPANLFGLSTHVASTQFYWQNDKFNISTIYKLRSRYFQQYTGDTDSRIRYTGGSETLDLRMGYELRDNISLTFEGTNLTNEPRRDSRAILNNVHQAFSYGPRFFAGVRVKF